MSIRENWKTMGALAVVAKDKYCFPSLEEYDGGVSLCMKSIK